MFALNFLRIRLASLLLVSVDVSLVSGLAVSVICRDAKELEQHFEFQENLVDWICAPRMPTFHQARSSTLDAHRVRQTDKSRLQLARDGDKPTRHGSRLDRRLFFLSSLITVVGLMCSTRAVSTDAKKISIFLTGG